MEDYGISKGSSNEKCIPEILSPKVSRDLGRHDIAHVKCEPRIQFLLNVHALVLHQIGKVHLAPGLDYGLVLLDKQPSHMSKEETSSSIVRISIGLREFVVHSVVTSPVVNAALVGNRVAKHEEESNGKASFVGSVRP